MSQLTHESTKTSRVSTASTMEDGKRTHVAITVGKTPMEVYTFWRDFENLATFFKDVQDIRVESRERSHWIVKLKSGLGAEWNASITADEPGKKIAWRSEPGSEVETYGEVTFENAVGGQGCVVRCAMSYHVPGGKLAELATYFTGEDPETLTITNLKRLKAVLETGEYPTTEGQTSGRAEDQSPSTKH